ncbi:MAG TPA: polyprenyl synthetase family protein [Anaerolineales bacterium]|nr:polyprenyl synthetase family protein [Anaerolineales bacterium]
MRSQADGYHPNLAAALNHLLSSGGKRIRAVFTLLIGGMLKADPDRLVTLAAAIETLHTATLVHDDLIDGALVRRGIPTLNAQWSPAATVLTGDFVFARAARLASETESTKAMYRFSDTLATIVNGEVTQLFSSRGVASRENYYHRIYAKTASLFEAAASTAAILSPVEDDQVQEMARFGYEIGMAFQMVDDILDFTGQQATIGKPVAGDLRQGLITLPALYYIEHKPDDPDMQMILNSSFCDEPCLSRLLDSIRQSGAIEHAQLEAGQSIQRALDILAQKPACREREALEDLANYIVRRDI